VTCTILIRDSRHRAEALEKVAAGSDTGEAERTSLVAQANEEPASWGIEMDLRAFGFRPSANSPSWKVTALTTHSVVQTARQAIALRRSERSSRRLLVRELAEYRTPAERLELDAILDRYPPDETRELRRILAARLPFDSAQLAGRWPVGS
jgi:hypothetical protein